MLRSIARTLLLQLHKREAVWFAQTCILTLLCKYSFPDKFRLIRASSLIL